MDTRKQGEQGTQEAFNMVEDALNRYSRDRRKQRENEMEQARNLPQEHQPLPSSNIESILGE